VIAAAWWAAALVLLAAMVFSLVFVWRARAGVESLLAALLLGTTGVALALVLGLALGQPRAIDVALSLALLAAVLGVAFVLRGWSAEDGEERP
jgi:multicomponent Na+:H+ antiporter subunit F